MKPILFWIAAGIVAWLGLRHLFSILTGWDQCGSVRPGQRLCHATSLVLLMGSSVAGAIFRSWWVLLAGVVSEQLFRRLVAWTGKKFPLDEDEKQMSFKQFIKHIAKRRNDKT